LKVEKEKEINNSDPMIKEILEGKVLYSKGVPILKNLKVEKEKEINNSDPMLYLK